MASAVSIKSTKLELYTLKLIVPISFSISFVSKRIEDEPSIYANSTSNVKRYYFARV